MSSADNAFVQSIKWLVKWIAIVILGLLLLVGTGAAIVYAWEWYSYDRHVARIVIFASNDAVQDSRTDGPITNRQRCTGEFPIFVGVLNGSSKTITTMKVNMTAHLPGHSTNILSYSAFISMDNVIKAEEGWSNCYRFPLNETYKGNLEAPTAVYSGAAYDVEFSE